MTPIRIALILLGGLFLCLGPFLSPGDGDLYWQRWLGDLILFTHRLPTALGPETFTAAGAPWVPQEWLFGLIVATATNLHAFFLLSLLVSALPGLILFSIYLRSRGTPSVATALALTLCGIAMLEAFGVRAQVVAWAAFAAFLFFLDRPDRWYFAALPTVVVWANLHASVALAPIVLVARICAALADDGLRALRGNRDVFMLPGVVVATCCTPLGWRLPLFAISFVHSPIRQYIQEWQPPTLGDLSFVAGVLPLALAIAVGGRATLLGDKRGVFVSLPLFLAAVLAQRNMPLFAIAAAPTAALGVAARFPRLQALEARWRGMERAALAFVGGAVAISAVFLSTYRSHDPPRLPVTAIATLGGDGREHRLYCADFTWCSLGLLYPRLRVFIDGRCDAYPLDVWRDYASVERAQPGWSDSMQRYGVTTVIAQRGSRLAIALAASPRWKRSFSDRRYVVYERA